MDKYFKYIFIYCFLFLFTNTRIFRKCQGWILGFKPIEEDMKENNKKLQGIY
ncbi:conserved hypothetical protein (plasmid) [Borreliella spielmanii A14S]|uniref:Uncharacterized protein n=1 Tax=Borreliella spielmanii A14S TaxID=498742 RepID=C0RCG4_9SPIR|nr:conserved hypothetical protein [Borreliella spielmanii A14S]